MTASRIDTSVFSFSPCGDANEVEFKIRKFSQIWLQKNVKIKILSILHNFLLHDRTQ